jgi:hypothetical protein
VGVKSLEDYDRSADASDRRVTGHLCLLGAFVSTAFLYGELFGPKRMAVGPLLILVTILLVAADALFVTKLVAAYRDARRIRRGDLRLDPSYSVLSELREENDIAALAGYLEEPNASAWLRERASFMIATTKPGGGKSSALRPSTDPNAISILAPLLEGDPDPAVRRNAAYGLRGTGDQAACKSLIGALSDADPATRTHATIGLGDLRSRDAVESLSRLLSDSSCRLSAARALVKIGDERALGPLRDAARQDRFPRRRRKLEATVLDLEIRVGLRER